MESVVSRAAAPAIPTPQPSRMPMVPPRSAVRTASVMSRRLISLRWVPVARRTPISRVRSRTLTSTVLARPDRALSRVKTSMAPIAMEIWRT